MTIAERRRADAYGSVDLDGRRIWLLADWTWDADEPKLEEAARTLVPLFDIPESAGNPAAWALRTLNDQLDGRGVTYSMKPGAFDLPHGKRGQAQESLAPHPLHRVIGELRPCDLPARYAEEPLKSEAQRRWMWANDPEMARRWEDETPDGKDLPERVSGESWLDTWKRGPLASEAWSQHEGPRGGTYYLRDGDQESKTYRRPGKLEPRPAGPVAQSGTTAKQDSLADAIAAVAAGQVSDRARDLYDEPDYQQAHEMRDLRNAYPALRRAQDAITGLALLDRPAELEAWAGGQADPQTTEGLNTLAALAPRFYPEPLTLYRAKSHWKGEALGLWTDSIDEADRLGGVLETREVRPDEIVAGPKMSADLNRGRMFLVRGDGQDHTSHFPLTEPLQKFADGLGKPAYVNADRYVSQPAEPVLDAIHDQLGREWPDEDYARLGGALEGAKVFLTGDQDTLEISIESPEYFCGRAVGVVDGQLVMENQQFEVYRDHQGRGLGTKVFAQQIAACERMGVRKIGCEAARSFEMNGYYTWPRLGYDAELTADEWAGRASKKKYQSLTGESDEAIRRAVLEGIEKLGLPRDRSFRLQDLMQFPDGRALWKRYGVTLRCEFDPRPGSVSRRVFDAYVKAKFPDLLAAESWARLWEHDGDEPLELEIPDRRVNEFDVGPDEDEEVFARIWDRIAAEEAGGRRRISEAAPLGRVQVVENAFDPHYILARELGIIQEDWIPYHGPRDGTGWENTETGEVAYVTDRPSEIDDDDSLADQQSETAVSVKMNWERAKEIGTHGGCGELAAAIIKHFGGIPMLRYDKDGSAVHAAVKLNGELIHLGDDDSRLVEVTPEEFDRAREEDLYADRVDLQDGELDAVIRMMFPNRLSESEAIASEDWTQHRGPRGGTYWLQDGDPASKTYRKPGNGGTAPDRASDPASDPVPARQDTPQATGQDLLGTEAIRSAVAHWTPEQRKADWKANNVVGVSFKAWFGDWEHDWENASKVVDSETGRPKEAGEIPCTGSVVTDDEGKPVVVYHGTPSGGFTEFDPAHADEEALYGPGFYFTENINLAKEYEQRGEASYLAVTNEIADDLERELATRLPDGWSLKRYDSTLDYEDPNWMKQGNTYLVFPDGTETAIIRRPSGPSDGLKEPQIMRRDVETLIPQNLGWSEAETQSWRKKLLDMKAIVPSEIKAVYLNIRRPFDADRSSLSPDDVARLLEHYDGVDEGMVHSLSLIHERMLDPDENARVTYRDMETRYGKARTNEVLRAAGYDGLTHIGGRIMGHTDHRVWIAFDPTQIKAVENAGTFDESKPNMYEAWTPYRGKRGGVGWQWDGQGKPRYQKDMPRERGPGVSVDLPDTQAGVSSAGSVASDPQRALFDKSGEPAPAREPAKSQSELENRYARVADLYRQDAGVSEGYSIGEHTGMVMDMWDRQTRPDELTALSERLGVDVPRVMQTALMLHDIGKPLAIEEGEKWRQHEFTLPIMADVMAQEGFGPREVKLAQAVVGHDIFGDVLKGRLEASDGASQLIVKAKDAGVDPVAFSELASLYFTADAASYPYLYNKVFREGAGGRLEFKSPAYRELMDEVAAQSRPAEPEAKELPQGSEAVKQHVATWTPEEKERDWQERGTRGGSFKSFFGDWEHDLENCSKVLDQETGEPKETAEISGEGSKVTDDDGLPKIVYHGTVRGGFAAFDPTKMKDPDGLLYGPGFYFTEDPEIASEYAGKKVWNISDSLETREEAERLLAEKAQEWTERYGGKMEEFKLGVREDGVGWRVFGEGYEQWSEKVLDREANAADIGRLRDIWHGEMERAEQAGNEDEVTRARIRYLAAAKSLQAIEEGGAWKTNERVQWVWQHLVGSLPGDERLREQLGIKLVERPVKSETKAVYLNIRNPLDVDKVYPPDLVERFCAAMDLRPRLRDALMWKQEGRTGDELVQTMYNGGYGKQRVQEALMALGFDGITHIGGKIVGHKDHRVWIAFEPTQIKAKDNRGTFDTSSANMYESWLASYGTRVALEAWDETKVVRDQEGQFAEKGGSGGYTPRPKKPAKLELSSRLRLKRLEDVVKERAAEYERAKAIYPSRKQRDKAEREGSKRALDEATEILERNRGGIPVDGGTDAQQQMMRDALDEVASRYPRTAAKIDRIEVTEHTGWAHAKFRILGNKQWIEINPTLVTSPSIARQAIAHELTHAAAHGKSLPEDEEERKALARGKAWEEWTRYEGPRGGVYWLKDGQGKPRYQKEQPGDADAGQKRARPGGEIGPNREFYRGGTFIATTELPKMAQASLERAASKGKVQYEPYKWVVPEPGKLSIIGSASLSPIAGAILRNEPDAVNDASLAYLRISRELVQDMAQRYAAGERWLDATDYPELMNFNDVARMVKAGMPVPDGALFTRADIASRLGITEAELPVVAATEATDGFSKLKATGLEPERRGDRTVVKAEIPMPPQIQTLAQALKLDDNVKLYAVGGAVRDFLMNRLHEPGKPYRPKDVDLTTNLSEAEILERLSSPEAAALGIRVKAKESVDTFGVVFANVNGVDFEVAPFRQDIGTADGRRPERVERGTMEQDAARRDLTINNLYYDFGKGEILDLNPDGQGLRDIAERITRPVGDPAQRFEEDRLRVLRLVRFFSRFNEGEIRDFLDPQTLAAVEKYRDLPGVTPERIETEFAAGLQKARSPAAYLENYRQLGLLDRTFQGLMVNTDDLARVAQTRDRPTVLAWLLRDEPQVRDGLNRLKYSNDVSNRVQFLVDAMNMSPEEAPRIVRTKEQIRLAPNAALAGGVPISPEKIEALNRQRDEELRGQLLALAAVVTEREAAIRLRHLAVYEPPKISGTELAETGFSGPEIGREQRRRVEQHYRDSLEAFRQSRLAAESWRRSQGKRLAVAGDGSGPSA